MRVSRRSKYPVVLTKLRWLEPNELENQKEFGREITHIQIELPKITLLPGKSSSSIFVRFKEYGGYFLAMFSALCFSIAALASKMLIQQNFHIFTIALWKSIGMGVMGPILVIFFRFVMKVKIFECISPIVGKPDGRKTLLLLMVIPVLGYTGVLFQLESLRYLNLADSTAISYSTPIAAAFFVVLLTGEPSWRGIITTVLTGLITLCGVIVLTRPPQFTGMGEFDHNVLIGTGFALGCMFTLSTAAILCRSIQDVHFSIMILVNGLVSTIGSIIALAIISRFEIPQNEEDWVLAIGNAVFSLLGQGFLILSAEWARDHQSYSGTSDYFAQMTAIFLAFTWQFIFLGVYPDVLSIVGAGVIMFGISTTVLGTWLKNSHKEVPKKVVCSARSRSWLHLK